MDVVLNNTKVEYGTPISGEVFVTTQNGVLLNGTVKFELNNKVYEVNVQNGKGQINIKDKIPANHYQFIANFTESTGNYEMAYKEVSLDITKANVDIDVKYTNNTQENVSADITLPDNITGNVTVKVDNVTFGTVNITNGTGNFTFDNITPGKHNITVIYPGDENHNGTNTTTEITVMATAVLNLNINLDKNVLIYGEKLTGNVTVIYSNGTKANGETILLINGTRYVVPIVDGVGDLNIETIFNVGEYDIKADFISDKYESVQNTSSFIVSKKHVEIEVTYTNTTYGNVSGVITIPDNITGNVTVKVDNVTYGTVNITNGTGNFTLDNVTPGNHNITIIYPGNENYNNATDNNEIEVIKADIAKLELTANDITYGEDLKVELVLLNNKGEGITGTVYLDLLGITYLVDVMDGKGNITISDIIPQGSYEIEATFEDDIYNKIQNQTTFKVTGLKPNMNVTIETNSNGTITGNVTLPEDATGNVTIIVDGKEYTNVTVVNGTANFTISDLPTGKHNITVIYSGDDKYASEIFEEEIEIKGNSSNDSNVPSNKQSSINDQKNKESEFNENSLENIKTGNPLVLLLAIFIIPLRRKIRFN